MKRVMNIEIGTEILPDDPKWAWDPRNPVSGTTKFYVRVAEELAKKGHNVSVLKRGEPVKHNGVTYSTAETWPVHLALDCNVDIPRAGARKAFQWTSFFNRPDTCVGEGYDRLILISDYVHSTLEHVVKAPVSVIELATDHVVIGNPGTLNRQKVCCYTSSPDRGGQLLSAIWPEVEAETGYKLVTSPYDGKFSDEDLRALYRSSRFWLFPALGTDSIISTLEAQAAGCIPFYVPHMGLPETCRYGVTTDLFRFKDDLIRTLKNDDAVILEQLERRADGLTHKPIPTWSVVADRILELV